MSGPIDRYTAPRVHSQEDPDRGTMNVDEREGEAPGIVDRAWDRLSSCANSVLKALWGGRGQDPQLGIAEESFGVTVSYREESTRLLGLLTLFRGIYAKNDRFRELYDRQYDAYQRLYGPSTNPLTINIERPVREEDNVFVGTPSDFLDIERDSAEVLDQLEDAIAICRGVVEGHPELAEIAQAAITPLQAGSTVVEVDEDGEPIESSLDAEETSARDLIEFGPGVEERGG